MFYWKIIEYQIWFIIKNHQRNEGNIKNIKLNLELLINGKFFDLKS